MIVQHFLLSFSWQIFLFLSPFKPFSSPKHFVSYLLLLLKVTRLFINDAIYDAKDFFSFFVHYLNARNYFMQLDC